MASKTADTPKTEAAPAHAPEAAAAAGGGIKAFVPLIANLVLMPLLAYATVTFVVAPRLNPQAPAADAAADDGHGAKPDDGHGAKPADSHGAKPAKAASGGHGGGQGGSGKVVVPLSQKILVNVAGTLGTRYLLVNLSLVGAGEELKHKMEKNEAELRDVAASALASKTIVDLERPGARNLIRSELLSVINGVLGAGSVQEIYFTDFAIQ